MYPSRRQGALTWSDNQLSDQFIHYHNKIGGVPERHTPANLVRSCRPRRPFLRHGNWVSHK